MRVSGPQTRRLPRSQAEYVERVCSRVFAPQVPTGKLAVSGYIEASLLRLSNHVASVVRILTRPCITLSVLILGFSRIIQALIDSGASLNLIHEDLVLTLGLPTVPCVSIYVTIANGSKLIHANRVVVRKFTIAGVLHEETFLVAPLGSNQMILGMPWLERVNPDIDWKLRRVSYRSPSIEPTEIPTEFPTSNAVVKSNVPHSPSPLSHDESHDVATPEPRCSPSIPTIRPHPIVESRDPRSPTVVSQPESSEHIPCSTDVVPQPESLERESCSPDSSQDPRVPKKAKKVRMAGPCVTVPFRRPSPKRPTHAIPISLTKRLEKGDMVSLVFLNQILGEQVSITEAVTQEELPLTQIPECYRDLSDMFSKKEAETLPPHRGASDHHIPLEEGAKPVFGPIYNLSELELKVLKEYIERNLKKKWIRPSTSPFGSPVLFVKKPDGSLRLCVDYRALNRMTIKNRYPLPLISEIMDRIKGATRFTRLDVLDAFNRIRIAEGEEWKTAFRTRYGHFEYLVMPFGLCNAPASFQSYINDALREYLDDFCIAYMDDVLVYSSGTLEEHIEHVRKVLVRLKERGLFVKPEKCEFHVTETKFLGFIISPDGVRMDPERIQTIVEWPAPKSVHDLRVFLGFANFYRRFIEAYSRIVSPLTALLRKSSKFRWGKEAQEAFDALKKAFSTEPVLRHFDPDLAITMHADSSGAAISGIISQPHDGLLHPVAFWSRKCTPAECNYDIHDREMLAIVESMKHWRHYLEGAKFPVQILSDHKNLEVFMSTKMLNRRQARWAEFLANYDFVLVHIEGKKNPADGPSRRPDYMEDVEVPTGTLIPRSALRMLRPEDLQPVATSCTPQNLVTLVKSSLQEADWCRIGVHAASSPEASLRSRFIAALQNDPLAQKVRENPTAPWSWQDDLLLHDNLVYVPHDDALRVELMQTHHDDSLAGHYGVAKTLELLTRNYYFPGIQSYVRKYVSSCDLCSRGKSPRHLKHGELAPLPVPTGPWKGISCDLVVDLPISNGYDSILVFVDRFTKMCHLVPCNKTTSSPEFAKLFLDHVIRLHGIPESIVSDRGSIFTSQFWTALSKFLNLGKRMSTAFHPQTDGQTERMNQTVEQYLRIYCNYQQDDWSQHLSLAEFSYNNTQHASIGCSPFYANYGYNAQFNVDLRKFANYPVQAAKDMAERLKHLHEDLSELIKSAQNQQAKYYDAKHKRVEFNVGDKVWLLSQNIHTQRPSKKLDWKRLGPFPILERIGTQAYRLELPSSMKIHPVFHISLLDRYIESDIPTRVQPPPQPVIVDNQVEFEAEEVLDSKIMHKRLFYLVKWKGYPVSDNSWEPAPNLANAKDLVDSFHVKYPNKPSAPLTAPPPKVTKRKTRSARSGRKVNFSTVFYFSEF